MGWSIHASPKPLLLAMKTLPLAAFALTLLASSLPLIAPVQAGTAIQRCEAADGTTVYTDAPCSLLSAASRPLPGDLLNRIARDEARNTSSPEYASAAAPTGITAGAGRRAPTAGCARTPTQLAMDLRGSLAIGDVNRLAESYHWVGLSQKQSRPIMQRLERLAGQTLEDTRYYDARIGSGGMQFADAGASAGNAAIGVMQLQLGAPTREVMDLEVARYAGCYFVKF